ncbi:hypothetical protein [Nocardia goodfellowii]|uniref:Uncharacterized protein n=1 Tax=Nocardia goodfellowii TaxID=882446 RepID=A0ABS4QU34_9NOCA|nr:hypothetical protein [Nocardia goodfellowii]MBP2194559.1 hypothetical protein [Nocardia goodfellowii]
MSHSERADTLANQANKALEELLELTQADADGKPRENASALAGLGGPSGPSRTEVLWQRLEAIQRQAQIHATLAVSDNIYRTG